MISSLCSTTANFFFLLLVHFSLYKPFGPLCYHMHQLVSCAKDPGSALSTNYDPGLLYVAPNLLCELVDARESSLLPNTPHEADVYNAPVEIPLEVEEIGLDSALCAPEGGSHPDVRTCGIFFFPEADLSSVDSAGRYHGVHIGQHVGCREADRPAALVSDHYLAPEHVGTTKEAGGLGHFSTGDQSPYAGGADPTRHAPTAYLNADGRSTRLPHEPEEVTEVAGSLMPETKVLAHYDHPGPTLANQHVLYELLWGLPGQVDIERYHPHLISPVTEQHLTPQLQRREQLRRITGPQYSPWMRMERGRYDLHAPPPPLLDSPPQDLLVAEVHAVEVPERYHYRAHSTTSARPASSSSLYTANSSPPHITR